MEGREAIIALYVKNNKNWKDTYDDIRNKYLPTENELQDGKDYEEMMKDVYGIRLITIVDKEYPEDLKFCGLPQFVLEIKE